MNKIGVFEGIIIALLAAGVLAVSLYPGLRNEKKLQAMGKNRAVFEAFFSALEAETGCKVLITSGYRDAEKQKKLHKQNPKNAPAGKSRHEKKKAMDINLVCWDGMLKKATPKDKWKAKGVHLVAKKHKLIWGGNFKNYYDPVHFAIR